MLVLQWHRQRAVQTKLVELRQKLNAAGIGKGK
ncbi:hypothetical protein FORC89_1808 [Salmonella sp. FORC89]|nr:not available [Salmonella enterica]AUC48790.1 Glycerol-3-phosphate ABC transporter, ATP-binding protein UgpC [Salmonella enterica subsp. enterica serovar Typhimurium]UWN37252.1 hypothetical protein FORC89_1808 [Salmonella sp. FORC89]